MRFWSGSRKGLHEKEWIAHIYSGAGEDSTGGGKTGSELECSVLKHGKGEPPEGLLGRLGGKSATSGKREEEELVRCTSCIVQRERGDIDSTSSKGKKEGHPDYDGGKRKRRTSLTN